jgi:putative flippase GtrA
LSWLGSLDRETFAQGARFALVGGFITVLYVAVTTLLRTVADAPWALAIAVGYAVATSTHFVLHRRVVFRREQGFQLSMAQQLPRFVAVVVCQYAATATAMAVLPGLLGLPSLLVFFGVAAVVTVASFAILRTQLFH